MNFEGKLIVDNFGRLWRDKGDGYQVDMEAPRLIPSKLVNGYQSRSYSITQDGRLYDVISNRIHPIELPEYGEVKLIDVNPHHSKIPVVTDQNIGCILDQELNPIFTWENVKFIQCILVNMNNQSNPVITYVDIHNNYRELSVDRSNGRYDVISNTIIYSIKGEILGVTYDEVITTQAIYKLNFQEVDNLTIHEFGFEIKDYGVVYHEVHRIGVRRSFLLLDDEGFVHMMDNGEITKKSNLMSDRLDDGSKWVKFLRSENGWEVGIINEFGHAYLVDSKLSLRPIAIPRDAFHQTSLKRALK
jgi:hypothetical protein